MRQAKIPRSSCCATVLLLHTARLALRYDCCPGKNPVTAMAPFPAVSGKLGSMKIRLKRSSGVPYPFMFSNPKKFRLVALAFDILLV